MKNKFGLEDKNPMWKGDNVGYSAIHEWINLRKKKPLFCERCGIDKLLDLANISGEYKRDVNDYEYLCRKCHMTKDGRIENLVASNIGRTKLELIKCLFCNKIFKPTDHRKKCCSRSCGQYQRNKNEKNM